MNSTRACTCVYCSLMLVTSQIGKDLLNIQQTNSCFVLQLNEWGDFHIVCIRFIHTTECGMLEIQRYWFGWRLHASVFFTFTLVNKTNDKNTLSEDYYYGKGTEAGTGRLHIYHDSHCCIVTLNDEIWNPIVLKEWKINIKENWKLLHAVYVKMGGRFSFSIFFTKIKPKFRIYPWLYLKTNTG